MKRKSIFIAAVVGLTATLPAVAQFVNPNADIPGTVTPPPPTPPPTPVGTQPTPPPVPAPVVPPPAPAPAPVYSSPLLVGQGAGSPGQTLQSVLNSLNNQIANFNSAAGPDLPSASNSRSSQVIIPTGGSSNPAQTPGPASSGFSNSVSDFSNPSPAVPAPPVPSPSNPAITQISIDVSGWSYLVLQWGTTNHNFYVGDASGVKTFSGSAPLSSYSFFTSAAAAAGVVSVPETASTLVLLGAALAAMGVTRRRARCQA